MGLMKSLVLFKYHNFVHKIDRACSCIHSWSSDAFKNARWVQNCWNDLKYYNTNQKKC